MLSVDEALQSILREVRAFAAETVALEDVLGLVTAAAIISDIDSPPFDKSLMDGYTVRAADISTESTTLLVIEERTAGHMPSKTVAAGEATRIMTGAPIPVGADAVVKIDGGAVQIQGTLTVDDNRHAVAFEFRITLFVVGLIESQRIAETAAAPAGHANSELNAFFVVLFLHNLLYFGRGLFR